MSRICKLINKNVKYFSDDFVEENHKTPNPREMIATFSDRELSAIRNIVEEQYSLRKAKTKPLYQLEKAFHEWNRKFER